MTEKKTAKKIPTKRTTEHASKEKRTTKPLKKKTPTEHAAESNCRAPRKKRVADTKIGGVGGVLREEPTPYGRKDSETVNSLRFIDLFAGIGGIRLALERAGGKCVFSSEWDSDANKTYEAYFGDKPAGDITQIQNSEIPGHDILAGGFPCQAFSIIGGMKGFGDTRGTLFFEIERILRAKQPKAFLLENVRNHVSHDKGQTFKVILEPSFK